MAYGQRVINRAGRSLGLRDRLGAARSTHCGWSPPLVLLPGYLSRKHGKWLGLLQPLTIDLQLFSAPPPTTIGSCLTPCSPGK